MKLFKRLAVILTAIMAVVGIAVFAAACDKGGNEEGYATDTFTVTVLGEDGNPIDGTTFGDNYGETQVKIQFCAVKADGDASACLGNYQPDVGANGKVTVDLTKLKTFVENNEASKFVIHFINLDGKGYSPLGNYGVYEIDKVPKTLTVTLDKNQTEEI